MKYELYIKGVGYVGQVNSLAEAKRIATDYGVEPIKGVGFQVSKL